MLFQGSPLTDLEDFDVDVLTAMGSHAIREEAERTWQMLVLLEVQNKPIVGKMSMGGGLMKQIPIDEMLKTLAKICATESKDLLADEALFNPALQKYAVALGVMYTAAMVRDDDPMAEALLHEQEVMGEIHMDHVGPGHLPVRHVLMRHLNGLYYSYFHHVQDVEEVEAPIARVDKAGDAASMFGPIGEGLEAMTDVLKVMTKKTVEVRNG